MPTKPIAKVWVYPSKSGGQPHNTLLYDDGTTSCNCMGWTRRVDTNGKRTCTHVQDVDMGVADQHAASFKVYIKDVEPISAVQSAPTPRPRKPEQGRLPNAPAPGRKFDFDD